MLVIHHDSHGAEQIYTVHGFLLAFILLYCTDFEYIYGVTQTTTL